MLELINRARANPEAEAARYGIDLNESLAPGTITPAPKPPLAFNTQLMHASREHSQWMLNTNRFSHTGALGSSPSDRAADADYTGGLCCWENIAWAGTSGGNINLSDRIKSHHEGLFQSSGHRTNILETNVQVLGVGQLKGTMQSSNGRLWLASMVTEMFARESQHYLTGVIYQDLNGNQFYDVGEGIGGAQITAGGESMTTPDTGVYALPLSEGTHTVTVSGSPIPTEVSQSISIESANRKLDVIVEGTEVSVNTW
nr:CAP domain-containing protein [Gilvimarinus xylanilyticus]